MYASIEPKIQLDRNIPVALLSTQLTLRTMTPCNYSDLLVLAYHFEYNFITSFYRVAGRLLIGLGSGMVGAPARVYTCEVTQPHLRGMLGALASVGVSTGVLIQVSSSCIITVHLMGITCKDKKTKDKDYLFTHYSEFLAIE